METPLRNKRLAAVANSATNFTTPLKLPASPALEKLGYGTGVEVLRVKRSPRVGGEVRSPWAIKRINNRLKIADLSLYKARLVEEAEILRKLEHPNIVGFRRFEKTPDGRECLAMEDGHTSLGNMLEELFETGHEEPLPAQRILKVCSDTAAGLDYLHQVARLLHGDLKSFNILVKGDFAVCKLCDFGVSLPLNANGFLDLARKPDAVYTGTDIWSAPEALLGDQSLISTRCDIFSFGMVIYEMFAMVPPHTLEDWDTEKSHVSVLDSDEEADEERMKENSVEVKCGTRPALPDIDFSKDYDDLIALFYICSSEEADERPSAAEIVKFCKTYNK